MHMQTQSVQALKRPAPQNANHDFVAHNKAFHQSAAMHAARMIRFQYSPSAKSECRRECVEHLRASLAGGEA